MRDLRRFAGHTYRRLAAPFGRRALDRMLRDGLPARLERPLAFLFTGERSPELLALETRIEARRAELAKRPEVYRRGPMRWLEVWPDAPDGSAISSKRLANQSSVPRRWGTFLHLCAGELAARAIVEMGACLGISGAYLASAASQPRFITIEGSPALAPIAEETLSLFSGDARVLRMSIESGIGRALALLGQGTHDWIPGAARVSAARPWDGVRLFSSDGLPVVGGVVRAPIRYDMKQAAQPAPDKP